MDNPGELGTNIGVIAAQSLGEPTTQLSMKMFHSGGVLEPGKKTVYSGFSHLDDLLKAKSTIANSAKLSPVAGTVTRVDPDPAGGTRVTVSDGKKGHSIWTPKPMTHIRVGKRVGAGDPLSPGVINPQEQLPLAGLNKTRETLTSQIHNLYDGGTRRRHVEMTVRAMTNLGKITDPGDLHGMLHGDVVNLNTVVEMNKGLPKTKRRAMYRPVVKGVNRLPLDKPGDWATKMALSHLKKSVTEGALQGYKSEIHGASPIPGLIYGGEFGRGPRKGRPY